MYLENNREMMLKLFLGSEQTMETNPTYASAGCPKNVTIQNRYGFRYGNICIFPTISLSNGRRLTGYVIYDHDTKRGVIPRVAVESG